MLILKNMTKNKITVNMVSESEFSIQGHGVHTAFKEMTNALTSRTDIEIEVNSKKKSDIVHLHTVGPYSLVKLNSRYGKKVVSAHIIPDSLVGSIVGAKYWRRVAKSWLKFFYGKADLVLACSGMVRDELVNNLGLNNVDVLYNTVRMEHYKWTLEERRQARQSLGITDNDFVVVGNGQVQPRKKIDTFIAMAKSKPEARFFWVGGMPFKVAAADGLNMQKMIETAPKNVTFTGVIPLEDVRKYYVVADVFVLPSLQENHPMCVLEAAGAGLPIILRDIPEYNDTFKGDVLMAKDDREFVALLDSLENDAPLRDEYREKAKNIAKRFDSATGAELVVEFYQSLLKD